MRESASSRSVRQLAEHANAFVASEGAVDLVEVRSVTEAAIPSR